MESFPLEDLPEENIIKIIGHLSLWDAFALETTNTRMRRLVRAHQKVQKFVDISFPTALVGATREKAVRRGREQMLLTRFGPHLLQLKGCEDLTYGDESEDFLKKLASACPNLIELPAYHVPTLLTYTSGRSAALKKIEIGAGKLTADQVKNLFLMSPQLEDLVILFTARWIWDENLAHAIEASVARGTRIRKLEVEYIVRNEAPIANVLQLMSKLPHLEHLRLRLVEYHFFGALDEPFDEAVCSVLKKFLAKSSFLKEIEFVFKSQHLLATTFASYVTGMTIGYPYSGYPYTVASCDLSKFTNLKNAKIEFSTGEDSTFSALVLPQSVRKLRFQDLWKYAHVKLVKECIKKYGHQFESISMYNKRDDGESSNGDFDDQGACYALRTLLTGKQLHWTTQLLISMSKYSTMLQSLDISVDADDGFDSEHLRTFLKTRGKQLKHFNVDPQILSLSTLELISVECKSLETLKICINSRYDISENILKNLVKGMANLCIAHVRLSTFNGLTKVWDNLPYGYYVNKKFILRRP